MQVISRSLNFASCIVFMALADSFMVFTKLPE